MNVRRDGTDSRLEQPQTSPGDRRYQELFELAGELIVLLDADGLVREVNPATEQTLGYSCAEMVGRPFARFLPAGKVSEVAERIAAKLDGSHPKAVVSLGQTLGMMVIGEGVENRTQIEFLRRLGCDAAQGFHLGRPQGASDISALLAA